MGLDILTPKGQETVAQLERAVSLWHGHRTNRMYVATPADEPASVDAVLADAEGVVRAVVETKCRSNISLEGFRTTFKNEWLVTMDKLTRACRVSEMLCVPLVGFLYLVDEDVLLVQKLTDSKGQFCVPFRCDNTVTQKTVNGGEIVRANAYIDMSKCRVYERRPSGAVASGVPGGVHPAGEVSPLQSGGASAGRGPAQGTVRPNPEPAHTKA
jgi:hypothetical protein